MYNNMILKQQNIHRLIQRFLGCYNSEGKVVFDQDEIEEEVLHHFSNRFQAKRTPVYSINSELEKENSEDNEEVRNGKEHEDDVCSPITITELDLLLEKLPNQKSCGVDLIPNEFLKNCGFAFKQYLLLFYNKIIEEGKVPSQLNIGKCCLIWKVSKRNLSLPLLMQQGKKKC